MSSLNHSLSSSVQEWIIKPGIEALKRHTVPLLSYRFYEHQELSYFQVIMYI